MVGQVQPPSEDGQFAPLSYTTWRALGTSLDNGR